MKTKSFLTIFLSILFTSLFAQTFENPYVESVGDRICFITKVELTKQYTIVSFDHLNNDGWIRLAPEIHISTADGKKFGFVKAEGIPLYPDQYHFGPEEKRHAFKVYFQPISKSIKEFDIIEVEPGSKFDFNFYGVNLNKKRISDQQKPHFSEEKEIVTDTVITHAHPQDFMGNFGNLYKDIYKYSIDSYFNYLEQPGKLKELAKLNKAYYDALIAEGFSREQALQILISTPFIPNTGGSK